MKQNQEKSMRKSVPYRRLTDGSSLYRAPSDQKNAAKNDAIVLGWIFDSY